VSDSPLPIIQVVTGFPSKKASLFIISTVKKERHSPETSCCTVKDEALPPVLSGSCLQALCIVCGGGRHVARHGMARHGTA